jgi:site-specific DNA-methyltransferase (cytosine-N4-specific)
MSNTESNGRYLRYCKALRIKPHPARYPATLPEFFIRMLTDPGDFVVDPFAGSCVTGEVCERIRRKWLCIEMEEEYLRGGLGRFKGIDKKAKAAQVDDKKASEPTAYKIFQPGFGWNGAAGPMLSQDGGRKRVLRPK